MKSKRLLNLILIFLVTTFIASSIASAVPLYITEAKVDGTELYPWDTTRLNLERDEEFDVKLELYAYEDGSDIEIEAFISGYEYNDFARISDATHVFDVEADTTYKKTLTLKLPGNVPQDDYRLRVLITDRNGYAEISEYTIQVDTERHKLKIADVTLSPGSKVKAGQALLASVRVHNRGDKREKNVKVSFKIPQLGLSASTYIEEIEENDQVGSEELYIRIPKNVKPGIYQAVVDVEYDQKHESVAGAVNIEILENDAVNTAEEADETDVVFGQTDLSPQEFSMVMESQEPVTEDRVSTDAESKVKNWLELILVLLIILLALVGLIVGFTSLKR